MNRPALVVVVWGMLALALALALLLISQLAATKCRHFAITHFFVSPCHSVAAAGCCKRKVLFVVVVLLLTFLFAVFSLPLCYC